jgi:hypothetical protein
MRAASSSASTVNSAVAKTNFADPGDVLETNFRGHSRNESGTRGPEPARENAAAGDVKLSAEVCQEIDRILGGSRALTEREV